MLTGDEFVARAERELLAETHDGMEKLIAWAHDLPPAAQHTFLPMLLAFKRQEFEPRSKSPVTTHEPDRTAASRLALMLLRLHTGEPAWSSDLLARLVRAAASIPQGSINDLFKATWQMLGGLNGPMHRYVASFIKDLAVTVLWQRNTHQGVDFDWMLSASESMTEAQAYFLFRALVLQPSLFTAEIEERVQSVMEGSSYCSEVR